MANLNVTQFSEGELPSEQIVREAKKTLEVVDSLGRRLTLKKPNYLEKTRFLRAVGKECNGNNYHLASLMPAIYVKAINADAVPFPHTFIEVEALVKRLDDEGIECIEANLELLEPGSKTLEESKEIIKNS